MLLPPPLHCLGGGLVSPCRASSKRGTASGPSPASPLRGVLTKATAARGTVPSHLPSHPAGTCSRGSQRGLALPWNSQVGAGEGAGGVTANTPMLMKDQFNSAISAGGGECKLSNILHSCSYSNPSPDLANRHFHV